MMKQLLILIAVTSLLTACANTLKGVGQDTEAAGQVIQKKAEQKKN